MLLMSRIERGLVRSENFCPGFAQSAYSHENRQQDGGRLHPENGRHTLHMHASCYAGDMEICFGQRNSPVSRIPAGFAKYSRIPAGFAKYRSGLAVEKLLGQQRLAVEEVCVLKVEQSVGLVQTGPSCQR